MTLPVLFSIIDAYDYFYGLKAVSFVRIDLYSLLSGRADSIRVDYSFVPATDGDCVILPSDVSLTAPIRVKGDISDNNGYMLLSCKVEADIKTECARCLDEINRTVALDFIRYVAVDRKIVEDDAIDEDDVIYTDDGAVEFDCEVVEQLSLELPTFFLCKDDCPGLCPKCGKKLADGDCGCREEKTIDPRFAILQKLLDNSENK